MAQKNALISPIHALVGAVLYGVATALVCIHFAQERPWLGLSFSYDAKEGAAVVRASKGPSSHIPVGTRVDTVRSASDELKLNELDFVAEPDGAMGSYKTYDDFLSRQERMAQMMTSGEIVFRDLQGVEWTVKPETERPLLDLPVEFWIQLVVGVVAWLLSASVWALRPREPGSRYLLLNGFGMNMSALCAAPYTTRELAMPSNLFWWIDGLNFFGGHLFIGSLVALLLYYPKKLAPRWVGWGVIALYVGWYILQDNGFFESMTDARRQLVLVGMLVSFVLAGVHWVKTRKDPIARAALQWFLLSWLVATSIFSSILFIPQVFGVNTSGLQSYGFALFLLMYVGLGFGILRFHLFGLGEWWYRIVFWVIAMLLLVILDMAFIFGLNLPNRVSLSAALLICGVFWFPLRSFLQSRLMPRPVPWSSNFKEVVDVALSPSKAQQVELYMDLLKKYYNPLIVHPVENSSREVELVEYGQGLLVPSFVGLPSYRLEFAHGGQKLFSPKDVSSAKELGEMLEHTVESQNAYRKGVVEERHRIAQDLHDDVGARLLNGLYTSENNLRSTIQEALVDIRSIVNGISGEKVPLSHFMADLRHESVERCRAAGIGMNWPVEQNWKEDFTLDYRIYKALSSSVREIISNAIKHSQAKSVTVRVELAPETLRLAFADDGQGMNQEALDGTSSGNGLKILKRRIAELAGKVAVKSSTAGSEVIISIPMTH